MINSNTGNQQDTVKVKQAVFKDSAGLKSDSVITFRQKTSGDSVKQIRKIIQEASAPAIVDTTSVCVRNTISDVTFYDSANIVKQIVPGARDRFPYIFTGINRSKDAEAKAILIRQLKPGEKMPENPLHGDWIILIILTAAFLFSMVRSASKSFAHEITRFFLFRGINDPSSRDIGGIFHWQSTILNLISFSIIALFFSLFSAFYGIIPSGVSVFSAFLITEGIIFTAITLRHGACIITGSISDQSEVFREYLVGVYQSYRYGSLILFIVIVLLSYSFILPETVYFSAGLFALGLMYLIRVIRLFIIFLNRNISIFYLILYLCALEILPVAISVKYFAGLI